MFNRALQVKVVKTKKTETNPDRPETYEEKVAVINNSIDRAIRKIGMFAIGYIVLDTFRQVLVASANK